jgi:hypothetical protein
MARAASTIRMPAASVLASTSGADGIPEVDEPALHATAAHSLPLVAGA